MASLGSHTPTLQQHHNNTTTLQHYSKTTTTKVHVWQPTVGFNVGQTFGVKTEAGVHVIQERHLLLSRRLGHGRHSPAILVGARDDRGPDLVLVPDGLQSTSTNI